jgi:hypothetical protein
MDTVSFITSELGDDLVVSFAVQTPDDPLEIESLTLLRTPKYESLLDPHERGVSVSFERHPDDGDERDLLQEVRYSERDATVELKTAARDYRLDVRKVDPEEIAEMREVFRKMNFDGRFRLIGM